MSRGLGTRVDRCLNAINRAKSLSKNFMGGRMTCEQTARIIEGALRDEFERTPNGRRVGLKKGGGTALRLAYDAVMVELVNQLEVRHAHSNGSRPAVTR